MQKSIFALIIAIGILPSTALAKDKERGNHKSEASFRDHDKHHDRDRDRDRRKEHDRDHARNQFRDRHHTSASNRPAGWSKGKKTGWGNCNVPPGQAKKNGCNDGRVAHHRPDHDRRPSPVHHETDRRHRPTTTTTTTTTAAVRTSPVNDRDRSTRSARTQR